MDVPHQWREHRDVWRNKPALRAIYQDFYRRVGEWLVAGTTLELGSGSGSSKEFFPNAVAVDVKPAPWLDLVADAHALPFADASVANVVLIDVLHHLAEPRRFLEESNRVLAPGGRIILVEPAVTATSWLFYRFFHPERLEFDVDPLTQIDERCRQDPYDGNQAVPTLLFDRSHAGLREAFPSLTVRYKSFLSLFAYPLSGGFRRWGLVPPSAALPLVRVEERLLPLLGKWMAFRLMVVMERTEH